MKNGKKFLSVLLSVVMLFTMVLSITADETVTTADPAATTATAAPAAATGAVALSDIDPETIVGKAVTKLVSTGIINGYPDGTYKADNTITRAEFAKVIVTFLGLSDIGTGELASGFADVDSVNHWGKPYIKLAVDKGIVAGYPEDNTFRPDNPVKYSEAVKMIVCALNYGDVAVSRTVAGTPWYSGYIAQAGDLKILSNTNVNNNEDPASRGTVAVLIYNALDAEVATVTTSSSGKVTTTSSGKTAQETYLKSEDLTGVVVACSQTSLSAADSGVKGRRITVEEGTGTNTYTVPSDTDTFALLGYRIKASISQDSINEYKDITGISKDSKNETIKITPRNIDNVTASSITYWASDTAKKASNLNFDNKMSVIYNGRYLGTMGSGCSEADFDIKSGNLTFVCNDGDGKAEVAFINDCEVYAVSSSGTDSATKLKKIYTLYKRGDIIVPDTGLIVKINNKGTEVESGASFSVSKYDIINLYRSKDGEVFDMTVTRNKISGAVTEVSNNDSISIKDKEYDFEYNFAHLDDADKINFTTGNNANVYLDAYGEIAAAENTTASADSSVYVGYLVFGEKESGVDGTAKVRLYGIAGKTGSQIYTLASKVKIDGTQYSSYGDMLSALEDSATQANASKVESMDGITKGMSVTKYSQLIKYTLNAAGLIDTIDTPSANVSTANDDMEMSLVYPDNTNDRYSGTWDGKYMYKSGYTFYDDKGDTNESNDTAVMGINSSTKVLLVPENLNEIESYRLSSSSYFTTQTKYRVEGYCFNTSKVASYVIVYSGKSETGFTYNSDIAIAKNVTQVSSTSGNSALQDKFTGWNLKTGAVISDLRTDKEGQLYGDIQTGEIVRYTLDDTFVDDTEMILEVEDGKPVLFKDNKGFNALDSAESTDAAKEKRSVKYDTRTDAASVCRFVYGTVLTKNTESGNVITLTSTINSDANGIDTSTSDIFTMASSAKYFVIDFTETKEDSIVTADSTFEELRSVEEIGSGDISEASQVLLYYSGGTVRTVIILKY